MFSLKFVFILKMDFERICLGGRSVKKPSELLHIQYRLLVFHHSKKKKDQIDIEGAREFVASITSKIPIVVHQQSTEPNKIILDSTK